MLSKITHPSSIIVACVAASLLANSAIAQTNSTSPTDSTSSPSQTTKTDKTPATHTTSHSTYFEDTLESTDNALERAFMDQGGYFWDNTTIEHQLKFNFGLFYPDNAITKDNKVGHIVYTDMLEQQVASDPIIRTPDLPNPFNSSLRSNPSYLGIGGITPVTGSEFVLER